MVQLEEVDREEVQRHRQGRPLSTVRETYARTTRVLTSTRGESVGRGWRDGDNRDGTSASRFHPALANDFDTFKQADQLALVSTLALVNIFARRLLAVEARILSRAQQSSSVLPSIRRRAKRASLHVKP